MKVTKVTAEVQYSKSLSNGSGWKKVNLGAEATVTAKEDWQGAQRALYSDLATQLRDLFINGAKSNPEPPPAPANPAPTPKEKGKPARKLCTLHGKPMTLRSGENGAEWYSHQLADGSWCNGDKKK